jgi:hypothetical protein
MAVKKNTTKKKKINDTVLVSLYMDSVLSNNAEPKNVYIFCKDNDIEESDFYSFYGSIDALKEDIWIKLYENTASNLTKDENFASYSNRNKLLSLYFTMFEVLTLNRSYVYYTLKESKDGLKALKQLKGLRTHFKSFINQIIDENEEPKNEQIQKITKPLFAEGAWIQFLFLLKFWLDDTSKGFEKTDIMIEKSVKAVLDVLDTTPLESVIDLGKFIWKERFN